MEDNVKQRLIRFVKSQNLTQAEFQRRCNLSAGYINNMVSSIGTSKLEQILSEFPQLNREWLLYGEGEMLKPKPQVVQNNFIGDNNYVNGVAAHHNIKDKEHQGVGEIIVVEEAQRPIIPSEWACKPNLDIIDKVFKNPDKVDKSRFIVLDNPVDIWIEVRDDSLVPRAYRGDRLGLLVYPKGKEDPIWGKFHAIDTWSNGIVVRKLYPAEGGYRCVSPNDEFPDLFIARENIISVSRVVYVVRRAL